MVMMIMVVMMMALVVVVVPSVEAKKRYVNSLPNGNSIRLNGASCPATGHTGCSGKGSARATNRFGRWQVILLD